MEYYIIKYNNEGVMQEYSLHPALFENLIYFFEDDYEIAINEIYIYEYSRDPEKDRDYTESDFRDQKYSIKSFHEFLSSLYEYTIYRFGFKIKNKPIECYIDEELIHITIKGEKNDLLLDRVMKAFKVFDEQKCKKYLLANLNKYVCFDRLSNPLYSSESFVDTCDYLTKTESPDGADL